MPLVVYSLLRLALLGGCWALLLWAGLHPLLALAAAALLAWGLSYVALPGPRDSAARWLAERAAARKTGDGMTAHQRRDAHDEDAAVDAAAGVGGPAGAGHRAGADDRADVGTSAGASDSIGADSSRPVGLGSGDSTAGAPDEPGGEPRDEPRDESADEPRDESADDRTGDPRVGTGDEPGRRQSASPSPSSTP